MDATHIRLEENQKLCFHYGNTRQQLLKYVRIARKSNGSIVKSILRRRQAWHPI